MCEIFVARTKCQVNLRKRFKMSHVIVQYPCWNGRNIPGIYVSYLYIHKYIFSPIKKNKELYGWRIYIYMVIFVSDAVPLDAGQVVDGENRNIITRNDTATTKNKVGKWLERERRGKKGNRLYVVKRTLTACGLALSMELCLVGSNRSVGIMRATVTSTGRLPASSWQTGEKKNNRTTGKKTTSTNEYIYVGNQTDCVRRTQRVDPVAGQQGNSLIAPSWTQKSDNS